MSIKKKSGTQARKRQTPRDNSLLIGPHKKARPILYEGEKPVKAKINLKKLNFSLEEPIRGHFSEYDLQAVARIDRNHSIHEIQTGHYFKVKKTAVRSIAMTDDVIKGEKMMLLFINPKSPEVKRGEMKMNKSTSGTYRVTKKALLEKLFRFYNIKAAPRNLDEMVKLWFKVIPVISGTGEEVYALRYFNTISNVQG